MTELRGFLMLYAVFIGLLLLLIVGPWYRVYLNWRGRT